MMALSNQAPAFAPITPSEAAPETLRLEFKRNIGHISRQSIVFFIGSLFTMAAGYLVKIYVARVLGAEQLGLYALGMTLVTLTQLLSGVGLQGAAGRYVAVYNATGKFDELRGFLTRSVGVVVLLNLTFSAVMVLCGGWMARHFYHAPALGQYIPLFAALTVLGSINVFYCQVLAGFKDVAKRTVITSFIGGSLVIALTVALLTLGTGMWGYLAAQLITAVVVVALLMGTAWKLTPPSARFSSAPLPPFDPEIKAFALASLGMAAIEFLVCQADKILLGLYLNPSLVGIYVLASTLSAFIPIFLQSVNQIFAPVIADLHAHARQDILQMLFQTLTKWVLGLTFPLASVLILFSAPLLRIFGADFVAGWPVLVVGAIGQVVNCGVGSVGYLLLMSGNQRRLVRVQFAMAAVSVVVNLSLIPTLGILGAAIAAACVNVGANVWNLFEVRKALRIFPYNRSYFALLLPAAVATAAAGALRFFMASFSHAWLAITLALVLSYVIFGGLALAFSLDADDRIIARSAWSQLCGGLRKAGVSLS